ncbi:MAG: hypothetical protein ABFD60_17795, partial [Bryobacteraceae bacterium]
ANMLPSSLRLGLAIEFLVAIVAIFVLWAQVGGQEHLDFMPWYWKLIPALGAVYAVVRATASAMEGERAWNRKSAGWLACLVAWMVLMAVVTYYYHLREPIEEEEETVIETPIHL